MSPGGTRIYLRKAIGKDKNKSLEGQVGREGRYNGSVLSGPYRKDMKYCSGVFMNSNKSPLVARLPFLGRITVSHVNTRSICTVPALKPPVLVFGIGSR